MKQGKKLKLLQMNFIFSQALEHEIDHLNGILFIDHLKEHEKLVKNGIDDGHHNHDVNYSVNVEDNIKKEKFDSKLYTSRQE